MEISIGASPWLRYLGGLLITGTMALSLSSCSLLVDAGRKQCETDSECTDRGGDFGESQCVAGFCEPPEEPSNSCTMDDDCKADMRCVDDACMVDADPLWSCTDAEDDAGTEDIEVFVPVAPVIEGASAKGLTLRVCYKVDPACEAPLDEVVLDGAGVDLSLPSGFNGYIEVDDPTYYPTLYFFPARMHTGATLPGLSLLPVGAVGALGSAAGAELDPTRGHILLNAVSCDGESAEGVQFTSKLVDELATQFYVDESVAVAGLTATTVSGSGGYINFPRGGASITVSKQGIEGSEGELGSVSLLVRAGFISMARFAPAGY